MSQEKYTTDQIIAALKETNGLISLAARRLGCSPNTIYARARNTQSIQQTIDDYREELVDLAELSLRRAIVEGEGWAVNFALKTIGKKRGYVERTETEQSGEVVIRVIRDANTGS